MIQSDKFDSSNMDIKKLSNSALLFVIKRLIEIFGVSVSLIGILILFLLFLILRRSKFYFSREYRNQKYFGLSGQLDVRFNFTIYWANSIFIPITYIFTGVKYF